MTPNTIIYDCEKRVLCRLSKFITLSYVVRLAEELGLMPTTWTEQAAMCGRVQTFRTYDLAVKALDITYFSPIFED